MGRDHLFTGRSGFEQVAFVSVETKSMKTIVSVKINCTSGKILSPCPSKFSLHTYGRVGVPRDPGNSLAISSLLEAGSVASWEEVPGSCSFPE